MHNAETGIVLLALDALYHTKWTNINFNDISLLKKKKLF